MKGKQRKNSSTMPEENTAVIEMEEDDDDNVVDLTEDGDEKDDDDEKVTEFTEELEEEDDNENSKGKKEKDSEIEEELWKNFRWDMTQLDMEWEEVLKSASVNKDKLHISLEKFLKNKRVLHKLNSQEKLKDHIQTNCTE